MRKTARTRGISNQLMISGDSDPRWMHLCAGTCLCVGGLRDKTIQRSKRSHARVRLAQLAPLFRWKRRSILRWNRPNRFSCRQRGNKTNQTQSLRSVRWAEWGRMHRWRGGCVAWQLAQSSPLSVNRWKWAITLFDVARLNFYHPTSLLLLLLLLLDLSADFKAPHSSLVYLSLFSL